MMGFDLSKKIPELRNLFQRYPEIIAAVLFGSYKTPFFNERSDLDFGLIFDRPVDLKTELTIEAEISELLGIEQIDLINLNKAPLLLKYNAIASGEIIYESDYEKTSDFLEKVYNEFCDFEYGYRNLCEDFDFSLRETYHG